MAKQIGKRAFQLVTGNSLGLLFAVAVHAEIIWVFLALAFAPAAREVIAAAIALNGPPEGEVLMGIDARRRIHTFLQLPLDTFIGGNRDESLMLPFAKRHAPFLRTDEPRIYFLAEETHDALGAQRAIGFVFREFGLRFQPAQHFCLGGETIARKSF
nr:hypothetical protein [Hyphomonas johnsonii]